jgi:hypothetical protein
MAKKKDCAGGFSPEEVLGGRENRASCTVLVSQLFMILSKSFFLVDPVGPARDKKLSDIKSV